MVFGFYFTQTAEPRAKGRLPTPVLPAGTFPAGRAYTTRWNGFDGSIPLLAEAAPAGGFLNVVLDGSVDGVVRSVPLIARYEGNSAQSGYYESLALMVHRLALDSGDLASVLAPAGPRASPPPLEALSVSAGDKRLRRPACWCRPAARRVGARRTEGQDRARRLDRAGSAGSAVDPGRGRLPGVEVLANIVSGLLDSRIRQFPTMRWATNWSFC